MNSIPNFQRNQTSCGLPFDLEEYISNLVAEARAKYNSRYNNLVELLSKAITNNQNSLSI